MKTDLKIIKLILAVNLIEIVACGFTYDDEYADIDVDSYGLDISEKRFVTAEQPKYNSMIRGYTGPKRPEPKASYALPEGACNVAQYEKYLEPIHKKKPNADQISKLYKQFETNFTAGEFTLEEVCYHRINLLYCTNGTCKCLENKETYGLKEAKAESYDPFLLKHYKFCRAQENYICDRANEILICDEGLICGKKEVCKRVKGSAPDFRGNSFKIITGIIVTVITHFMHFATHD